MLWKAHLLKEEEVLLKAHLLKEEEECFEITPEDINVNKQEKWKNYF